MTIEVSICFTRFHTQIYLHGCPHRKSEERPDRQTKLLNIVLKIAIKIVYSIIFKLHTDNLIIFVCKDRG